MPTIPIQQTGISLDVGGADLNPGQQGLVEASLARAGGAVADLSLQIGNELMQQEAVQVVQKRRAERELQSKTKMAELKALSPDGYMWEEKNGVRTEVKNPDGSNRTITQEYRDWANQQFEQDQLTMPSRYAQDLYKSEMLPKFTDLIMEAQSMQFEKNHGATKLKADETALTRAKSIYSYPGPVAEVYKSSRDNFMQNSALIGPGGFSALEVEARALEQGKLLAESFGEGHYLVADKAITTKTPLPYRYIEDNYDIWTDQVKPGNQFVDFMKEKARRDLRNQIIEQNKERVAKGLPELPFPEEARTIVSMVDDETRDRLAHKFLSLMHTKKDRVNVEFEDQVNGHSSANMSKTVPLFLRREQKAANDEFVNRTLNEYIPNEHVLPLNGLQGIMKVKTTEKLGEFLASRNYWAKSDAEKRRIEAEAAPLATKLGNELYDRLQKNNLIKNKFSKVAVVGAAIKTWEDELRKERGVIEDQLRTNSALAAQDNNPTYRWAGEYINPNAPGGLANEIKTKASKVIPVWDAQAQDSTMAKGSTAGVNNFVLKPDQLQAWSKAFDSKDLNAKTLADLYESLPKLSNAHANNIMDGMIQAGLPEAYRSGMMIKGDRVLLEQVSQVLVDRGTSKAEEAFSKNYGADKLKDLNDTLIEKFQPFLPRLQNMEALKGRNSEAFINTMLSAARNNAIRAASGQTEFDAEKAATVGIESTLNKLFAVSDKSGGKQVMVPRVRVQQTKGKNGVEDKLIVQDEVTANKAKVFFDRVRLDPEVIFKLYPNIHTPSGLDKEQFKSMLKMTLNPELTKDGSGHKLFIDLNTKETGFRRVELFTKEADGKLKPIILNTTDVILMQEKYDAENPGWFQKTFGDKKKIVFPVEKGPKF